MSGSQAVQGDAALIAVDALQVGMFIHLDLSWMDHPFPQSRFKIKTMEQLATVRALGVRQVHWFPALSDGAEARPASPPAAPPGASVDVLARPGPSDAAAAEDAVAATRPVRQAPRLVAEREMARRCRQTLQQGVRQVRELSRLMHARPAQTAEQGQALVQQVVGDMLAQSDLVIRLMAETAGQESTYHHALNVTLLSVMLAKVLQLPGAVLQLIGVAALFHDIGKFEIPDRITRATAPLTRPETALLQTHTAKGVALARTMGLSAEIQKVIAQHHEQADGSGYPAQLKGDAISLPARIVAVVNAYDNLCNPLDVASALTPHEALGTLWRDRRAHFDQKILGAFVRSMGVYPPGTVVSLSDGQMALVTAVNSAQPLKPWVLVLDASHGRELAPLLDLQATLAPSIVKALRPEQVPAPVRESMALGARMAYHVGGSGATAAA